MCFIEIIKRDRMQHAEMSEVNFHPIIWGHNRIWESLDHNVISIIKYFNWSQNEAGVQLKPF